MATPETEDERIDSAPTTDSAASSPFLEILFHYDLRRIGERCDDGLSHAGAALTVGRMEPRFVPLHGRALALGDPPARTPRLPRPLEDRCVSREQLVITFLDRPARFLVEPNPAARLPVERVLLDGPRAFAPIAAGETVPPGTLLGLGRRVILRLALGGPAVLDEDRLAMLGESEVMWRLRRQIRTAARFPRANVLIVGETGSGKEHVARGLHAASGATGRFVALNMSGLDPAIAGSELFGHARGAFTGAYSDEPGAFAAAAGGTLFLDEIGDMPADVQSKLLRIVEERCFSPLGSRKSAEVSCRVVAASNKPLEPLVGAGRFRQDLFERLRALTIEVAPLRAHREDVPLLFRAFVAGQQLEQPSLGWLVRDGGPTDATPVPMEFVVDLMRNPWSGNVRALRNLVVATAAANLDGPRFVAPSTMPAAAPAAVPTDGPAAEPDQPPSCEPEPSQIGRAALLALLEEHDFQQGRVARKLGVARNTVIAWMRQHGIRRARDLSDDEIAEASRAAGGDTAEMARRLQVSPHALKLRLGD